MNIYDSLVVKEGHMKRVLVISDEPSIRRLAKQVLPILNYEPIVADGYEQLLHTVEKGHTYHAVLTDADLGDSMHDGSTVINLLKETCRIDRYILMTAFDRSHRLVRYILDNWPDVQYIEKPIHPEKLRRALAQSVPVVI